MAQLKEYEKDEWHLPEVQDYSVEKYKVIWHYAEMFTKSMRFKWKSRVYIDLFSGAGIARIKRTNRIIETSAFIAARLPFKFSKYIFCDINPQNITALENRANRYFPDIDASFVCADANESVHILKNLIPQASKEHTVLSFCLADPSKIGDLNFSTIKSLARNYLDFLILVPSGMEARRFKKGFLSSTDQRLTRFFGNPEWRFSWDKFRKTNDDFGAFVKYEFTQQMMELGFIDPGENRAYPVKIPVKNVLLYDLMFFSRSERGLEFWDKSRRGSRDQQRLFD